MEIRIHLCAVLDRPVHPMEYRLGPAHAYDANSHLSGPDVRLESAKSQYSKPII